MFVHVAFFKLKERNAENMEKVKNILMRVDGKVPTLNTIKVGTDVVGSDRSYDVALIATFDSREDMDAYQVHPVHLNEVKANLKSLVSSSVSVDFNS